MKCLRRLAFAALSAALLAACADQAALPAPAGPLTQQDVAESLADITGQLEAALDAEDEGIIALQGFPQAGALSNPFFGYGVTLMSARHPERAQGALQRFADFDLPSGEYTFSERDGSATWVMEAESDDLTLNWSYDTDPYTADTPGPAEASLTFDWDAQSPTIEVESSSGERIEVPTGLTFTMLADGDVVADVDVATTYYQAPGCGGGSAGILEPTSLTVDGTGSLLTLENVGYSVRESEAGDSFVTQGKLTLVEGGISFDWNVAVNGDLGRYQGCFSESISLGDGGVALTLAGLSDDTRSVALRFAFDDLGGGSAPVLSDGAVVVNGDENRAVTFSGSLADSDFNGVPGDSLTVRFADGSTTTLEQLLNRVAQAGTLLQFLRPP